jgi:tRNA pseudouridine38-40 synthase
LNDAAMQQAASLLVGRHNFSSFEGSLTNNTDPICHLQRLSIARRDDQIEIDTYADRFLKHMIRAIVGTLVEVGRRKRPPDELLSILNAHDRTMAGQTAPPHGLSLMQVDYDPADPAIP